MLKGVTFRPTLEEFVVHLKVPLVAVPAGCGVKAALSSVVDLFEKCASAPYFELQSMRFCSEREVRTPVFLWAIASRALGRKGN